MADTYTKIADLIDPEVMGDMVSARIPKKLRVAPFAKVDDTLAGVPGDTITVPAYAYIGDADIVAEGEAVTIEKMTTSTRKATVKKAMKGIGLTDEAVLSGYGNPVGEANTQLALAIAAKIDSASMQSLSILAAARPDIWPQTRSSRRSGSVSASKRPAGSLFPVPKEPYFFHSLINWRRSGSSVRSGA